MKRILVVEDEHAIREMIGFALKKAGLQFEEAADAEQALVAIASNPPDLVLLDWMLPGLSGVELARRLRREDVTAKLPIILLTARVEENDRVHGLEVGADDYITKPFSPRELIARINAVLRRSQAGGEERPLEFAGLELDPVGHRVQADGRRLDLAPTEFRLLHFFMRTPIGCTAGSSCWTMSGVVVSLSRSERWMCTYAGCARPWPRRPMIVLFRQSVVPATVSQPETERGKPWRNELQRIAALLLAGVFVGVIAGNIVLGLLIFITAYLCWHLYNVHRLVSWLRAGKKFRLPETGSIWDDVFEHIYRMQQRNRKRKRNLRRLLKRFHKMSDALPDAIVELAPGSDEIEWWNDAAAGFLGFKYPARQWSAYQ